MREQIKEYLQEEKKKLDNRQVKNLDLENVYPSIVYDVFGDIDEFDINGWQGDYWGSNDNYSFFGCMYYGICKINLK